MPPNLEKLFSSISFHSMTPYFFRAEINFFASNDQNVRPSFYPLAVGAPGKKMQISVWSCVVLGPSMHIA